jgi:hypothetical protein
MGAATIAVVAIVALLALGRGGSKGPPMQTTGKKKDLWVKLEALPLTPTQRYFLMLTAYGESGYNPHAHNDSQGETAASLEALANNPTLANRLAACGGNWGIGSGGLFGRLLPYFGDDMLDIFGSCSYVRPSNVFDSNLAILSAIRNAHRLQAHEGFKVEPTVGNLRLGWASPTWLGYLTKHADHIAKYREQAAHEKLPFGIVDATIEDFPNDYQTLYATLVNTV